MNEISASGLQPLGIDSNLHSRQNTMGEHRSYETQTPGLLISLKPGGSDIVPQNLNLIQNLNEPSFLQQDHPVKGEPYEPRYSTSSNFVQPHERPPHMQGRTSFDHLRSMEEPFRSVKQEIAEGMQHGSMNGSSAGMSALESNQDMFYSSGNGDSSADRGLDGSEGQGRGEWQGHQNHSKVHFTSSRHNHRTSRDLGTGHSDAERYQPSDLYPPQEDEYRNDKAAVGNRGKSMDTKQSIIQERLSMERPNRTLFVRNLDYGVSVDEVEQKFRMYGEIQHTFSRIDNRGMMFIKYFDIRAAELAKKEADGIVMNDRALDVHYALQKDVTKSRECREDDHHGSLCVRLKGDTYISDEDLKEFFLQYGDVKRIRPYRDRSSPRHVEFYDSRDCARAYHEAQGKQLGEGAVDCHFAWDEFLATPDHLLGTAAKVAERRERENRQHNPRYTRTPSPTPSRTSYNGSGFKSDKRSSYDDSGNRKRGSKDNSRDDDFAGRNRRDSYTPKNRRRRSESHDQDSHDRRDSFSRRDDRRDSTDRRDRRDRRDSRDSTDYDDRPRRDSSRSHKRDSFDRDSRKDWGRDREHDKERDQDRERDRGKGYNSHDHRREDSPPRNSHQRAFSESRPGHQAPDFIQGPAPHPLAAAPPPPPPPPAPPMIPYFATQAPGSVVPQFGVPNLSMQERMEQAQKAQQLMNNVLLGAGKTLPTTPTAIPLFGNAPGGTSFGQPSDDLRLAEAGALKTPFIPLMAPASQVAGSVQPAVTPPAPSLTTPATPVQASLVGTPLGLVRPLPIPAPTLPKAAPAGSTEPQKPSTETQVQQLLQLLVGES
ncbi:hypothetical protein B0O80DRAFT_106137 [Mortierella sp. GBAus27b]|nr:hypothetical protein B0O80DRAFT_106137 [Mortierella sp. GBAus27b]